MVPAWQLSPKLSELALHMGLMMDHEMRFPGVMR